MSKYQDGKRKYLEVKKQAEDIWEEVDNYVTVQIDGASVTLYYNSSNPLVIEEYSGDEVYLTDKGMMDLRDFLNEYLAD